MSESKKDMPGFSGNEEQEISNMNTVDEEIEQTEEPYEDNFGEPTEQSEDYEDIEPFLLDDMEALLRSVGLKDEEPKPEAPVKEENSFEFDKEIPTKEDEPEYGSEYDTEYDMEYDPDYVTGYEHKDKSENEPKDDIKEFQSKPREDFQTKVIPTDKTEKKEFNKPVTEKTSHYNLTRLFSSKEKAGAKIKTGENGGQIILDGYKEDLPENVSEAEVEAKLKTRRKHFVDNFRVLAKPTQDKPILERVSQSAKARSLADSVVSEEGKGLFDAVDKANKDISEKIAKQAAQREKAKENSEKSKNLKKELKESVRKKGLRLKILIGITGFAILMSIITAAYNPGGILEFLFGNGARIYTAVNVVLFAAGAAVSFGIFKKAVSDLKDYKITSSVCISLINIFILIQAAVSLIIGTNEETGFSSYIAFGLFIMTAEMYSDIMRERTLFRNLSVLGRAKELVGLQKVDNKSDADALAKQISRNDYPVIYYSADINIPENPVEIFESGRLDGRFYSFFTLVVMVVSLVLSVTVSIIQKKPSIIAASFTGCLCLCVPVLARVVGEVLHSFRVSSIASFGGVIMGMEACEEIGQANAFVFDSQDIFEARVSKFRVVPKSLIALSDTVVFAAATLKNTRSLLADSFDEFLAEYKISLPEAENVQYEDGLGYSSWVAGRRVLVGNREMLIAHSIPCPDEEQEAKYSKKRSVMYVAVEGMIVATFIVSYNVRSEVRKSVSTFKNTGIIIMFCASDPCLSEATAAEKLGVDAASVKLVTSPGSEIISAYKVHDDDRVDNGILCSKEKKNILALTCAAHGLCSAKHISRIIFIIAAVINFALLAFCAFLGVSVSFTSVTIIILQCLWSVVSYYIGKSRLR